MASAGSPNPAADVASPTSLGNLESSVWSPTSVTNASGASQQLQGSSTQSTTHLGVPAQRPATPNNHRPQTSNHQNAMSLAQFGLPSFGGFSDAPSDERDRFQEWDALRKEEIGKREWIVENRNPILVFLLMCLIAGIVLILFGVRGDDSKARSPQERFTDALMEFRHHWVPLLHRTTIDGFRPSASDEVVAFHSNQSGMLVSRYRDLFFQKKVDVMTSGSGGAEVLILEKSLYAHLDHDDGLADASSRLELPGVFLKVLKPRSSGPALWMNSTNETDGTDSADDELSDARRQTDATSGAVWHRLRTACFLLKYPIALSANVGQMGELDTPNVEGWGLDSFGDGRVGKSCYYPFDPSVQDYVPEDEWGSDGTGRGGKNNTDDDGLWEVKIQLRVVGDPLVAAQVMSMGKTVGVTDDDSSNGAKIVPRISTDAAIPEENSMNGRLLLAGIILAVFGFGGSVSIFILAALIEKSSKRRRAARKNDKLLAGRPTSPAGSMREASGKTPRRSNHASRRVSLHAAQASTTSSMMMPGMAYAVPPNHTRNHSTGSTSGDMIVQSVSIHSGSPLPPPNQPAAPGKDTTSSDPSRQPSTGSGSAHQTSGGGGGMRDYTAFRAGMNDSSSGGTPTPMVSFTTDVVGSNEVPTPTAASGPASPNVATQFHPQTSPANSGAQGAAGGPRGSPYRPSPSARGTRNDLPPTGSARNPAQPMRQEVTFAPETPDVDAPLPSVPGVTVEGPSPPNSMTNSSMSRRLSDESSHGPGGINGSQTNPPSPSVSAGAGGTPSQQQLLALQAAVARQHQQPPSELSGSGLSSPPPPPPAHRGTIVPTSPSSPPPLPGSLQEHYSPEIHGAVQSSPQWQQHAQSQSPNSRQPSVGTVQTSSSYFNSSQNVSTLSGTNSRVFDPSHYANANARQVSVIAPTDPSDNSSALNAREQKEFTSLLQALKEFKKGFKEINGRKPTRSETRADPTMGPVYARYAALAKRMGLDANDV